MSFTPSSQGLNAVSGISQAVSGIGSIVSAQNAVATGNYNANISMQQAQAQQQSFNLSLQEYQTTAAEDLSQQQASYAKSGVAFKGTPVDNMVESITNVNMNEAIMSYNNTIKVNGLQNQAALERYTATQEADKDYATGAMSLLGAGLTLEKQIGSPSQTNYTFTEASNQDPYATAGYI